MIDPSCSGTPVPLPKDQPLFQTSLALPAFAFLSGLVTKPRCGERGQMCGLPGKKSQLGQGARGEQKRPALLVPQGQGARPEAQE